MTGAPRLVLDKNLPGRQHELNGRNQLALAPDGQDGVDQPAVQRDRGAVRSGPLPHRPRRVRHRPQPGRHHHRPGRRGGRSRPRRGHRGAAADTARPHRSGQRPHVQPGRLPGRLDRRRQHRHRLGPRHRCRPAPTRPRRRQRPGARVLTARATPCTRRAPTTPSGSGTSPAGPASSSAPVRPASRGRLGERVTRTAELHRAQRPARPPVLRHHHGAPDGVRERDLLRGRSVRPGRQPLRRHGRR